MPEGFVETPTGQRVRAFYNQGSKQVLDVHNEAVHLAGLKKQGSGDLNLHKVEGTDRTACNCNAKGSVCQCAPGKCDCSSCPKNSDVKSSTQTAEQASLASALAPAAPSPLRCGFELVCTEGLTVPMM